jgi:hypothetical protein
MTLEQPNWPTWLGEEASDHLALLRPAVDDMLAFGRLAAWSAMSEGAAMSQMRHYVWAGRYSVSASSSGGARLI